MTFYATKCIKVTVGIITVHISDSPKEVYVYKSELMTNQPIQ